MLGVAAAAVVQVLRALNAAAFGKWGFAERLELCVCCSNNRIFNLFSSVSCSAAEFNTCLFPPQSKLPAASPAAFLWLTTTGLLCCVSSTALGALGMG